MNNHVLINAYETIPVKGLYHGKLLEATPHYIAHSKGKLSETPVFCLEDIRDNSFYMAYLRGLNERDVKEDKLYKMIVRGFGSFDEKINTGMVFLEERVEVDNLIHVCAEGLHNANPNRLVGKFMHYTVFINRKNSEDSLMVNQGDYVFGKACQVGGKENCFIDLAPVSVVNEERYSRNKNRIFR